MPPTKEAKAALASSVNGWFKNFGGTSALDVARDLSLDHSLVMRLFEELAKAGHGSINADVTLYQVSFDPENIAAGFKHEPVVTHIFFPSKQVLHDAFYSSDLPQQRLPEYTTRLHLGDHQIGLAYFTEEVLARYLDHPELYAINDSLAGGDISSLSSTPEERYLYVRYGKCRLGSGGIAVTAIFKDLSDMGLSEQRYWHSFEIESPNIDKSDTHFQNFLVRTYEGDFVDFEDPITRLLESIKGVNKALDPDNLFAKAQNVHLRLPVEQTYKSHCNAASELYKIVGPDNLSQSTLKDLLTKEFGIAPEELNHAESGRPLSTLQLLALLEEKLEVPGLLIKLLRPLSQLRAAADHKVLEVEAETRSYSREFAEICNELAASLEELARLLAERAT
ncbi:MAG: hypothetical protein ABL869_07240 [Candidatus Nitrotoga sp.]